MVSLRLTPIAGLVALIPTVLYLVVVGEPALALAAVSTALIAASLYWMFAPSDAEIASVSGN